MAKQDVFDFSEIFRWAEAKYGISWNLCNDLFFNTEVIEYRRSNDFYKFDMIDEDDVPGFSYDGLDAENAKAIMAFPISNDELLAAHKAKGGRWGWGDEDIKFVARVLINQFLIENDVESSALILGG